MPRPVGKIRILLSTRVIFDLEEADEIFKKDPKAYADYLRGRNDYKDAYDEAYNGRKLDKGPMFDFVRAALSLNTDRDAPVIEIGVICKDTAETALPIFRNLDMQGLIGIEARFAQAGRPVLLEEHQTFGTDLFLTRNAADAQTAVDANIAAAVINFPPGGVTYDFPPEGPIRFWVDGDAVMFGSSAERVYREQTLDFYKDNETNLFNQAIEPGPFTALLTKISAVNAAAEGDAPFELSLLTARGAGASTRVFTIAEHYNIHFNGHMIFLGGTEKKHALQSYRPHMFFDDQQTHLKDGMYHCATGLVPYATGCAMDEHLKLKAAQEFNVAASPEAPDAAAPVAVKLEQQGPPTQPKN